MRHFKVRLHLHPYFVYVSSNALVRPCKAAGSSELLMLPAAISFKQLSAEASSIMRALSGARCTDARLYTLRIKIGTNQRALGEHSHC